MKIKTIVLAAAVAAYAVCAEAATRFSKTFNIELPGISSSRSVKIPNSFTIISETSSTNLQYGYRPYSSESNIINIWPDNRYAADTMPKTQSSRSQSSSSSSAVVAIPEKWKKARVLNGVATKARTNSVAGLFTVKCGKANAKGTAKVSASYTPIGGKKKAYKAQTVNVTSGAVDVTWDDLTVTIDGDLFSGDDRTDGGISVGSADVGGNWTQTGAKVYVDLSSDVALPDGTIEDLLPTDGEPVTPKSGKWSFAKAAQVKWKQNALVVNTENGKTNLSATKLFYKPKTGIFKGTFKIYAIQNNRLKKFTAKANGIVIDGLGVGAVTLPGGGTTSIYVE